MYTEAAGKSEFRHFLDNQQYQTTGILRYERIFGQGYVSTGGLETTKVSASGIACSYWHSIAILTYPAVCNEMILVPRAWTSLTLGILRLESTDSHRCRL